jgi:hypothetical protein
VNTSRNTEDIVSPFGFKTMSLIGLGLVIITLALAAALYFKEVSRVIRINRGWVKKLIDSITIPLLIIFGLFIVFVFVR